MVYSYRCAYCIYSNIRQEFFSFPVYPLKNEEVVLLLHTTLSMFWSGIFRKIEYCDRSSSYRRLIMHVDKCGMWQVWYKLSAVMVYINFGLREELLRNTSKEKEGKKKGKERKKEYVLQHL
jgi:hypothetical protein